MRKQNLNKAAGLLIFEEVNELVNQQTNDYDYSKLFSFPPEYLDIFSLKSTGFSAISYKPYLEPERKESSL